MKLEDLRMYSAFWGGGHLSLNATNYGDINFPRGPLLAILGKKVEELFYGLGNYSYSAYDSCMGQLGMAVFP